MKGSLYCLVNFDETLITTDSDNFRTQIFEIFVLIAKTARLRGTSRVLSWGKINNQWFLTYQHLTVKIIAISVFRFKIWDAVPFFLIPLLCKLQNYAESHKE
jgi:hypothetical protein